MAQAGTIPIGHSPNNVTNVRWQYTNMETFVGVFFNTCGPCNMVTFENSVFYNKMLMQFINNSYQSKISLL